MDVDGYIEQLEELLAEARPMPLSSSVIVNRQEVEEVVDGLRAELPEELRQARWILKERDDLLAQAAREAEQLMSDTRAERERLLSDSEVVRGAEREAERIITEGREQGRILRLEAEDYVDGKLAELEMVLTTTLRTVGQGRERLRGRLSTDDVGEGSPAGGAGPGGEPGSSAAQFFNYEQAGESDPA